MISRAAAARADAAALTPAADYPEYRRGVLAGFASYAMWGVLPLFWPLL